MTVRPLIQLGIPKNRYATPLGHRKDTRLTLDTQDDLAGGIQDVSISSESPSIRITTAKIARLPPEMLISIFVHLSRPKPGLFGRKALHFVRDLVSVTHVCRSWRRVATTAPELWVWITMTNPKAVKVFLERSGAFPLKVDILPGYKAEVDNLLLRAVIPHTHRFRQLSVLTRRGAGSLSSILFTKPAPLLERLVIRHSLGDRPVLLFNDQTPRLRELVMFSRGLWLQNQLENLTSLHISLLHTTRTQSEFLPFFDMLRRCPVLEEMFILWNGWGTDLEPPQFPTVPLHRLRKLLLHCFRVENIKYLLHTFDLKTNGIAIHLSGVNPGLEENGTISDIQAVFPYDTSGRPALSSSTKVELTFHTRPRTVIIHAAGPGFSIRIDLRPHGSAGIDDMDYLYVNYTLHDVFSSVKELWVRGSCVDIKLDGIEHFTALEKLVFIGRGSGIARHFRQALSPRPSGILPCPLLSSIDCHWNATEMREMFLLLHKRYSADRLLERLRVPSCFIPVPTNVASCVKDIGNLDIPSGILPTYGMELPVFCFAEMEHEWWERWESRLN